MDETAVGISIFTLNCWGLGLGISKNRNERMKAIGDYLADQNYDVVLLQEIWKKENFDTIRSCLSSALPFSHHFNNGIIGTGTCVFSKVRINDVTFHHFGLNGYPHKLAHGDWFGGKGLGFGQIDFKGFNVNIFTSHYHATYNYNPLKDIYLGHRVVHGVESAQWIKLSSSSADLTIYAGDFNNEPSDIPYQIVKYVTPLKDAWVEANGTEGGETSETPNNTYTSRSSLRESPNGKRIDYIMYMAGPNIEANTISCSLPLPVRVPGKNISYSDHEGVAANIQIRRQHQQRITNRDYVRLQSTREVEMKKSVVGQGKQILEESLRQTRYAKVFYVLMTLVCILLLVTTFIPQQFGELYLATLVDIGLFFVRLCLIVTITYLCMMASLFLKRERHALRSTISTLNVILESYMEVDQLQNATDNCYTIPQEQLNNYAASGINISEVKSLSSAPSSDKNI